jgi:hypothetical protein
MPGENGKNERIQKRPLTDSYEEEVSGIKRRSFSAFLFRHYPQTAKPNHP